MDFNAPGYGSTRTDEIERLVAEVMLRLSAHLRPEAPTNCDYTELRITLRDRYVYCEGQALDLSRRPMVWRLFDLFQRAPAHTLTRSELAYAIYGVPELETHSERYRMAIHSNLVKLISRARIVASTHFGGEFNAGIDWFAYDHTTRTWAFYRIGPVRGRHLALSPAERLLALQQKASHEAPPVLPS